MTQWIRVQILSNPHKNLVWPQMYCSPNDVGTDRRISGVCWLKREWLNREPNVFLWPLPGYFSYGPSQR